MKSMPVVLCAWLAVASAVMASTDPGQSFAQAGVAYDAGRFAEAAQGYESIAGDGFAARELYFNLGNARFKEGRIGDSVLGYRRAWMLAPRDPDTMANLAFALQQAGAVPPDPPVLRKLALRLSLREWIGTATAAYWSGAVALLACLVFPARRAAMLRCAAVCGIVLAVALAGTASWWDLQRRPEAVVLADRQQALFAPVENSTPHFSLPAGSIVRIRESAGAWVKIKYGKDEGWIRRETCASVYPFTPTDRPS
ncbi:MAG TPA: hypothetical protein VIH35_08260 [Kiritimatiellia bacterium]|jgi:hypothetical protein